MVIAGSFSQHSLPDILGVPILISYAESDSMEPTIDRGDGFVVIPDAVAAPSKQVTSSSTNHRRSRAANSRPIASSTRPTTAT